MKIYVVAATMEEIEPLLEKGKNEYKLLINGLGVVPTTYHLTKVFREDRPGLAIQAGIAGSFETNLPLGTLVTVRQDRFADLGVKEKGEWKDLFDLGLAEKNESPFTDGWLINTNQIIDKLPLASVNSITINEISTNPAQIGEIRQKYHPAIESMEGAAFHYVCLQEEIPFIQLRSVSNYVGERNKSKWQIKKAVENLNKQLFNLIGQFANE
jgi:futalosine hydrolase